MEAALRLAARMRGEILTRLSRPRRAEDVERIERILKRIEREAMDEGFRDRQMLTQLFSAADRKIVERNYDDWENFRNAQVTGKLDRAFATKDYVLLREALVEVRTMNHSFMVLAAKRYAEMLAEDA
jgi:hypothetical protein